MNESPAVQDVILLDVPEPSESADPFEDAVTDEIVLLDVMRVDPADIEVL